MLIHTAEGKRSIDDDLVICIDRHRGENECCTVTVYCLAGNRLLAYWNSLCLPMTTPHRLLLDLAVARS